MFLYEAGSIENITEKKAVKWPVVYLTCHLTNTVNNYSVNCILKVAP